MRDLPADKRALLEQFDNFANFRNGLSVVAEEKEHWAGIPMPLKGQPLIVEPSYPNAKMFESFYAKEIPPELEKLKVRNHWWSDRLCAHIYIYEEDGKIAYAVHRKPHMFDHSLQVLGASYAWGIEQEARAVQLLATWLPHHTFKMYLLTGMFLETSPRSGLTYLFRKLRPTVVLDCRARDNSPLRILCALCLHPIAYYADSWAGAMCPTDDVIAHLMLMRGDEHLFWRRANQHHPSMPEAGL